MTNTGESGDDREAVVDPTALIAHRMATVMKQRGMTVRSLAERLADMGRVDITVHRLYNIHNHRVAIPVDVVLAVAAALDVAPLVLMTSATGEGDGSVEVMPSQQVSRERFNDWMTAQRPLPGADVEAFADHRPAGMSVAAGHVSPDERAQALARHLSDRVAAAEEIMTTLKDEVTQFSHELADLDEADLDDSDERALRALQRLMPNNEPDRHNRS
ncbi:hypothetical protein [Haloglycomyces albus]|uniref:hypothetical protein n=1 Tax=Haloglycomyces albus TaxID=526067 RepID=UPI0012EC00A5|nr:hypothetical protein [Haloglycomyces albus]